MKDAMARAQNSMPSDSFKLTEEADLNKVKDDAPEQLARPALLEAQPDH
jgi:hypothetical protein